MADMSTANRMQRFAIAVQALPLSERRNLLGALDEITRPMTPRELERALQSTRLSCDQRKAVVAALKRFPIIMLADEARR